MYLGIFQYFDIIFCCARSFKEGSKNVNKERHIHVSYSANAVPIIQVANTAVVAHIFFSVLHPSKTYPLSNIKTMHLIR